ncbi:MAG: hypothetical protein ACSHWS_03430 [Sulfitobacter sp.]
MRVLALLLALAIPLPAFALSCLAPSVEATYERAHKSPDAYVVVHGRLVVNEHKMPKTGSASQNPPEMTRIPATIRGQSLSKSGFHAPFEQNLTLEVACFGPWCGSVASGADVLAFIRRDTGGYALEINPCGGDVFVNPQPAKLKQVTRCFKRGRC